ncbi:non-functional NADPH-dependent codeinone reductase 2-like [Humulus lupulus]|uniref:non-functional NADPH-dependent codeinone reductase 2-like n=1 Tax=Humulus lupulus TaxID=3486 RepID=UPI002B401155|nr:non-functional NADPH-dependent codeinone reductase 2-like [Humulus lupulus]
MAAINVPESKLSSTQKLIPMVGFGTAEYPFGTSTADCMREAIVEAMRVGYRHFDSAALYQSEQSLGEAIEEALSLGIIKSRDDLFITTKLWCTDAHPQCVLPALNKSLKTLGLEYVDLYLIHWPVSVKMGVHEFPVKKNEIVPMDIKLVWEDMEECHNLGLAKAIGVSNFSCKKLELLLSTAKIPPAVNQVEMNPIWQQKKLREFCEEKGILIMAYSTLGAKGTPWGQTWVMDCEVLHQIANEKGKTIAQVCLRWAYEKGVSVLVKSFNKERMKANLDIFDWKLTNEEVQKISQIPQRRGFPALEFIFEDGPFKTVEDLWDGEI